MNSENNKRNYQRNKEFTPLHNLGGKMKIKYFFALIFALALLPIYANALDKNYCDNAVYKTYYDRFEGKNVTDDVKYVMGKRDNRGKYINETLAYCADPNLEDKCDWAMYGGDRHGYDKALVNMPTFALLLNNIPLFEALINRGGYGYLLDNGVYKVAEDKFNDEFLTQALQAVKEGQVGVLEYLIANYHPNLLKLSGYIYRSPRLPHAPVDAKTLAQNSLDKYQNRGEYARVECMREVKRIIDNWYQENASKREYIEDAESYNKIVLEWAPRYVVENDLPGEFNPSLNIFQLQGIEENFAQNIDKQIEILIENIMRDFDLSAFGNQA